MKEAIVYALLAVLILVTCLETKALEREKESESRRLNIFDKKMYQAISEEYSKDKLTNLIFSPVSLEILLAVAGLGARGNTKKQIAAAIGTPLELSTLRNQFRPIISGIKGNEGFTLRISSQIFVEQKFPLEEKFVNDTAEGFNCGTQLVDFNSNPDAAIVTINSWVDKNTNGLIKDLVDSSFVDPSTKVVLVNAVYFKGKWSMPFDPAFTTKRKFELADGNKLETATMLGLMTTKHGNSKELNAQYIELPYEGDRVSMVILLPDRTSDIAALERKVSTDAFDLNDLIYNDTEISEIVVSIPKFKVELSMNLQSSIEKVGILDMFTNKADFTGISSNNQGLKVNRVIQKSYIEVTEEGTEAAAATTLGDRISVGQSFYADRPFLFVLLHIDSGTRLFVGRVADPETFL